MTPASALESAVFVLLVEDGVDDVLLTRRCFRKAGIEHVLRVCEDGEAAIEYLMGREQIERPTANELPALVLLDWKLPKKNGLEVLRWIGAQSQLQGLPVVVVSASGQQDEIDQALAAGATAYLQKPLRTELLMQLFERPELARLKALMVSVRP